MDLLDLFLFPVYVVLFAVFFSARRKRLGDPVLQKYHRIAFWVKVMSAAAYVLFSSFFAKLDSTFLYYPEGMNITRLILKDPSNISLLFIEGKNFDYAMLANTLNKGYFASESNFLIARLVTVFSFFTFGSYSVITLIFSMIAFSGAWRLYRFFYEQYPHLHKQLAIAVLFLPNFVFWSSGILKDPVCTGMLGWFTYSMYSVFIKRKSVKRYLLMAIFAATVLAIVKSYILYSYLPFMMLYIVLTWFRNIKNFAVKGIMLLFTSVVFAGGFVLIGDRIQEEMASLAVDKLAESVQTTQQNFMRISDYAESTFSLGVEFDGTTAGLLKIAPAGIVATLYRPFLWESKKITSLMSSFESLALMLLTLYVFFKTGPFTFFGSIFKDPMISYCFLFSLVFALFVGVTTLNFGTLVRYKIPCMPFYVVALILILERWRNIKLKKKQQEVAAETEPAVD